MEELDNSKSLWLKCSSWGTGVADLAKLRHPVVQVDCSFRSGRLQGSAKRFEYVFVQDLFPSFLDPGVLTFLIFFARLLFAVRITFAD